MKIPSPYHFSNGQSLKEDNRFCDIVLREDNVTFVILAGST